MAYGTTKTSRPDHRHHSHSERPAAVGSAAISRRSHADPLRHRGLDRTEAWFVAAALAAVVLACGLMVSMAMLRW